MEILNLAEQSREKQRKAEKSLKSKKYTLASCLCKATSGLPLLGRRPTRAQAARLREEGEGAFWFVAFASRLRARGQ